MSAGTWNHRIVRRVRKYGDCWHTEFAIHEAYYDEGGRPEHITKNPCEVWGESVEELRETFQLMLKALDAPVLNYEDF